MHDYVELVLDGDGSEEYLEMYLEVDDYLVYDDPDVYLEDEYNG